MGVDEIYLDILRIVEEVTGVNASDILTSNCEESVDARHIFVYVLCECGLSDSRVSKLTKLTRPCVCIIRNGFKFRRKRYFVNLSYCEISNRVKKALKDNETVID